MRRRKIASTCDYARLGALLVLLERERREPSRKKAEDEAAKYKK